MHIRSTNVLRLRRSPLRGAVAGLLAGIFGAAAMNRYWAIVSAVRTARSGGASAARASEEDDATVRTASAISEKVAHHALTRGEKSVAGPAVHYAIGALTGAFYGALAELPPRARVSVGRGAAMGAAVWLSGDEVAVWLLGFAKPPTQYPASTHLLSLGAHLVYGMTTDLVCRIVRVAV
jgi:uncharacterized membrane protein YagU involved in acid resistance